MIEVGQWLGTGNQIIRLEPRSTGWVAYDSTGAEYRQSERPDGIKTFATPTDGTMDAPLQAWPTHPRSSDFVHVVTAPLFACNSCAKSFKTRGPALRHAYNCGS